MDKTNEGISVYLRDGGIYTISNKQILYWEMIYPDLDVKSEIGLLKEMWAVNAIPRKTAKNIDRFINKWLYSQSKEDL